MTYLEAEAKFNKCKDKTKGYRLSSNTRLHKIGNAFAIRLHNTDVVTIRPDGTYRLNSNGWKSVTTKSKMSSILPRPVYQSMGIWYIAEIPYYDGILISADGIPVGPHKMKDIKKIKQNVDKIFTQFLRIMFNTMSGPGNGANQAEWIHSLKAPSESSKVYAKKLWGTILSIVESNKMWKKHNRGQERDVWFGPAEYAERYKILQLSILRSGYQNPTFMWDYVKNDCMNGKSECIGKRIVRFFFSQKKVTIAEMIANGEM